MLFSINFDIINKFVEMLFMYNFDY